MESLIHDFDVSKSVKSQQSSKHFDDYISAIEHFFVVEIASSQHEESPENCGQLRSRGIA